MARRKAETPDAPHAPHALSGASALPLRGARVLLLSPRKARRDTLDSTLTSSGARVQGVADARTALGHADRCDLIVIDSGEALETCVQLADANPSAARVVLREAPDATFLVLAMRRGVSDVVDPAGPGLIDRLAAAWRRVRRTRLVEERQARRTRRMRDLCRTLFRTRHELLRQVGTLSADMAASYRDLSSRMRNVSMVSELNTVLRQELDLEGLLRTTLEYALKKSGPTNAAVFLPGTTGDYSLGAYVNYDCAKDSAESLLDHLADVAAPAFEPREDSVLLSNAEELAAALGPRADWLAGSTLLAFSCRHEGECMGVVIFFRDRRNPFPPAVVATLRVISDLFAQQLARVIRTHHRHLPKDQWHGPGDGGYGPDDIDLAA